MTQIEVKNERIKTNMRYTDYRKEFRAKKITRIKWDIGVMTQR